MNELDVGDEVFGSSQEQVFKVVRKLGRGAFGTVFEIRDRATGKSFALKSLGLVSSYSQVERNALFNEGKLAIGVQHQNVVEVMFFHDGSLHPALPPYVIMEYVRDGRTLKHEIDEREHGNYFSDDELNEKFRQLAAGMQAINAKLVHRDIKPDNILVQDAVYKIADFGLSKVVGAATRDNTLKGINAFIYCPPEAWRGEDNTQQMDMYCMGIVFFQLATLRLPYEVNTNQPPNVAWQNAHLYDQPINPRDIRPELNPVLSKSILKMLHKNPDRRYGSWTEILAKLAQASEVPQHATSEIPVEFDVSSLLEKDRETTEMARQAGLKNARIEREEEELKELVKRRFEEEFLNPARAIAAEFNSHSTVSTLDIRIRGDLKFIVEASHKNKTGSLNIDVEICPRAERFPPTENVEWVHQPKRIWAWGYAKYADKFGVNVVLVSANANDTRGTWKAVIKKNAITFDRTSPSIPYERYEREKMFARAVFYDGVLDFAWPFTSDSLLNLIRQIL